MAVAPEIENEHREALRNVLTVADVADPRDGSTRRAVQAGLVNYCPHGCQLEELDEYGYCHHLVGFTNDGKTFEGLRPLFRKDRDGKPYDSGYKQVVGGKSGREREEVLPTDKLINPQVVSMVEGRRQIGNLWVSARVYRKDVPDPLPEPAMAPRVEPEIEKLKRRKAELLKVKEEQLLRDEVKRLEAEVSDPVAE